MKHRGFLLAEICRVLDCRIHHIRYIEEQLPIISTAYDERGRKIYSLKDLFLFSRILTLTRRQGMGLKEAVDHLFGDLDKPSLDMTARFLQLRHELLKTRLQSVQSVNRLALKYDSSRMEPGWDGGGIPSGRLAPGAPISESPRFSPLGHFSRDLMLPGDSYEHINGRLAAALDERDSGTAPPVSELPESSRESAGEEVANILSRGGWLIITPDPYRESPSYPGVTAATPIRRLSMLEFMAESIRAAANEYGGFPLWVITVRRRHFHHLLGYLNSHNFFSIPVSSLVILPQPDFEDRSTGDAGALFSTVEMILPELVSAGLDFGMIYSMEHPMIPLPDENLVTRLFAGGHSLLGAGIRRGMSGELYFRISERLPLEPAKAPQAGVNTAVNWADTGRRGELALVYPIGYPIMVPRPRRWEYFPPFYRMERWDSSVLGDYLSRTHRSWAGTGEGAAEVSPLYARTREEFARRRSGEKRRSGLYI